MNNVRTRSILAVLCAALFVVVVPARAAGGSRVVESARPGRATPWVRRLADADDIVVPLSAIPMLADIPVRTDYYEIDPEVVEEGYFYYYYVRGKRQEYMVESTVRLYRLLHELAVLEELAKFDPVGEFFIDIGMSVKGMGVGLGHLVTKPGQSFRNVGVGIGRIFKKHPKTGTDEKGEDRGLLGAGPAGADRRKIAYDYHLDVYTDNPEVRHVLNVLARARSTGSTVASWTIPGSELGIFAGRSLRDEETEKLIRDAEPKDLRREIGKRLGALFGMEWQDRAAPVGRFVLNPNYTPRQLAYAGKCLADLARAKNAGMLLALLGEIDNPETADLAYVDLRMYHALHTRVRQLVEFVELENLVAARGADGVFYFFFPGDVLSGESVTPAEVDELIHEAMSRQAKALVVLCLGTVKPEYAAELQRRGVTVHQNLLRDPRFLGEAQ